MKVREVIDLAGRWVEESAAGLPGFRAAYLAGSVNGMAKDVLFPRFKDVDIHVVVEDLAGIAVPQRKFLYQGVLLESVYKSIEEHRSPEAVLASANAGNLACCVILSDPTGLLESLRTAVAADYARPDWIAARCEEQKLLFLQVLGQEESYPDKVYLLGCAVMFLGAMVALACLKNPTVRRGLAVAEELLRDRGRSDLHQDLLEMLGCARMERDQVIGHLDECVRAFDRAVEVIATPFYGSWNIDAGVRPYLIDGSYEMIDSGSHREAMLWITLMHCVANMAIQNDAPEAERSGYAAGVEHLRTALGISTAAAWQSRMALSRTVFDRVSGFAADIAARPA